jgi:hypothetical protein
LHLGRSARAAPPPPAPPRPSKPLQLLEGEEALAAARRGVEVLTAQSEGRGAGAAEAKRQLCPALCALAEMALANAAEPAEVGLSSPRGGVGRSARPGNSQRSASLQQCRDHRICGRIAEARDAIAYAHPSPSDCPPIGACLLQVAEEVAGLLQRARSADAASPEPLQALASLRYEQVRLAAGWARDGRARSQAGAGLAATVR